MDTVGDVKPVHDKAKRGGLRKIVGILSALFGLFWLAHKSSGAPLDHGHTAIVWPLLVIAGGLFVLFGTSRRHRN